MVMVTSNVLVGLRYAIVVVFDGCARADGSGKSVERDSWAIIVRIAVLIRTKYKCERHCLSVVHVGHE